MVARGKEARQRGGHDNGIAHQNIRFRLAHTRGRPRNGHQAHSAVEARHIELHLGAAIWAHGNRAAEIGHKLFGGRRAFHPHLGARISARADLAHRAVHPVNQATVKVAHLHTEAALAEIVLRRVGGFEGCEVENAQIDSCNRDIGGFPCRDPVDHERGLQRRTGIGGFGHIEAHLQGFRAGIDGGMGEAQGAGGIAACGHIHRADHRGGHISACAPVIGDGKADQVLAFADVYGLHGDQAVRKDLHHGHPCRARHEAEHRFVTCLVGGFIEAQLQHVGRAGGISRYGPTRVEAARGRNIIAVGALHDQFVAPPFDGTRHVNRHRTQQGLASRNRFAARDGLPVPRPVGLIPLIAGFDLVQRPLHLHRLRGQIGAKSDDLERSFGVLRHFIAVKRGLDPDHRHIRCDCARDPALDRAAGAFCHADAEFGFQRAIHLTGGRVEDIELQIALGIGDAIGDAVHHGRETLVLQAEGPTLPAFEGLCFAQDHIAFHVQISAGSAKKIAGGDFQRCRNSKRKRAFGKGKVEVDPLGQKILDEELRLRQRRAIGVGAHFQPVSSARGGAANRQAENIAAGLLALGQMAGIFDAIGAEKNGCHRQTVDRSCCAIACQNRGVDGFACAISAAIRGQEYIDGRGGFGAFNATIRQIESGIGKREEGDVFAPVLDHDERRRGRTKASRQTGFETRMPLAIGFNFTQNGIGAAQERHLGPRFRFGIRERAHHHMHPIRAFERCHAQIGQHKPLDSGGLVIGV